MHAGFYGREKGVAPVLTLRTKVICFQTWPQAPVPENSVISLLDKA